MAEQRYEAVRAVIADGETVTDVAARFGVARKTVHGWLARYEAGGLEALADRSHRPGSCPHQMDPRVEARVLALRRVHRSWGARRIRFELGKAGVAPVPSESGVYRALVRAGLIEPGARLRHKVPGHPHCRHGASVGRRPGGLCTKRHAALGRVQRRSTATMATGTDGMRP